MSIFHDKYDGYLLHICGDVPEKRNYDYKRGVYVWRRDAWREVWWDSPGGCLTCASCSDDTYNKCPLCGEELSHPAGEYPDVGLDSILESPYVVKVE